MGSASSAFFECPVCGEDVPFQALVCPECGADAATGWKEDAEITDAASSLDLPDEEFGYDQFLEREFGKSKSRSGKQLFWWIVGIVITLAFGALIIHGL